MDLHFILVYIFIMCVAVFTPVSTTKERVDDAEVAVLARRLYDEIKKRLRNYDDKEDGLQDVDMNMFSLQNETIIKTTNSLKRGAKFLNNSVVGSKEECAKLCFANIQCNIAVFHNKKSFSCYLFNCGTPSVCEFSSHPDYVTMGLPLRKPALSQQKKHENDLAQLPASITSVTTTTTAATATTKTSVSTSSPTTTTTSTTATTTTQAEPEIGKVQVKLFEKCGPLLGDCTDHYTECLTGICVCQEGYHAQEGTCRKECDRFEFECANLGRPLTYPQCIAVYDKCDGIAQCLDGSDELHCPAGGSHVSSDQVTHTAQAGSRTFTSDQQLQHEQEIKQLLQPPTLPSHPPVDPQQDTEDRRPNTPAIVGSREGAAHPKYPKTRVKTPVIQARVQDEGDKGVVGETQPGDTSKGVGVEEARYHSDRMDGSRAGHQWNGESFQGRADPGPGRMDEDKAHIHFDASRHRGIDGQDPSVKTEPGPMDGTMRGNMMRNYEPVVDSKDPQSNGRWNPASRHWSPDSYRPKAVDQLDAGGYARNGAFVNHGGNKPAEIHSDDGVVSRDPTDYNYRYYKVHHPSSGDSASRTPGSGFDKDYVVGSDRGPWRKTGHFGADDTRPVSGPVMDKNRVGYYYPRNPDQEGHGDYDSYYDNNGRKGYYNNDDGPGLFLPYRHHEVFDYYAQEPAPKDGDTQIDDHKPGGETSHKVKALPPPVIVKSTEPPVKAATVEPVKPVSSTDESILQPTHVKNDTSAADNNKKIVQDTNTTDKIQPEPHKVAGIIGPKGAGKAEKVVIISKEVIGSAIVHHEAKSDRGAVVALGLGLAVTAVLLLFVGCRLRNMKRKLRRGRPMNSNEADYLINGMYL